MWDAIWLNARLATMVPGRPYGEIADGAIAVEGGRIAWVGARAELTGPPERLARTVMDARMRWITPGLVDCHTHLVYGGDRAREFELRLQGASYEDIARAGGGIRSTVAATRAADEATLLASARRRLQALMAEGVTTIEIKSGYGLDRPTEIRMLQIARKLGQESGITVSTSFLGAHALPPEFEGRADDYIHFQAEEVLPAAAAEHLVDAVDAFCERIAFSPAQTRRMFQAARRLSLPVKLHAEQLSDQGGASLAASFGALSADHLEHLSEQGAADLKEAGSVAVLLPGAYYFLRESKVPPIDLLRRLEVPMALASDCNPGSSPMTSILMVLNMACTLFRLTPEEALAGVTRNGARALGLAARCGTLEAGKAADFVLWDVERPAELAYRISFNPLYQVVRGGGVLR
ncbi:MAG: imidazolonepropionase [Proteobacteria bacterium]|nr:imidazolonepropionase [Pseudomonadota bacterium]MBI3497576.1 imidazolonepropionase [Pseudomonadota bacterium]